MLVFSYTSRDGLESQFGKGPTMKLDIKNATKADLPGLLRLNKQIQQQHAEQFPKEFLFEPDAKGTRDFFKRLIDEDSQLLLIAHTADQSVGYLWCEIQRFPTSLFRPARSKLYVQHVCVDADHRRHGIASALFQQVDDLAKAAGITRIGLDTWAGNESAHSFFRSRGFETQQIIYGKNLD